MDILKTWVDKESKKERAKLYRNIDPNSICIIGRTVYFAHPGTWVSNLTSGKYKIDLSGCTYLIADPVAIKDEMKRFDFPGNGDLGYYNHIAQLKE